MIAITLTVNKANVYDEVAKTTSYTGAKMQGDESAYDRIFTTDDDRMMLERFWVESCAAATELLKPFLKNVSSQPESHGVELDRNYVVELELSSAFDIALTDSISASLFSFFVALIVGKWYKFTNKDETEGYVAEAAGMLEDVKRKIYYRKKPRRIDPK